VPTRKKKKKPKKKPVEFELALRITEDFARRWRFSVGHGKSNVVVFGSEAAKAAAEMRCWQFAGKRIRTASEYKYLGLEFVSGGHRGKWNTFLSRVYTKARSGTNMTAFVCGGANGAAPHISASQWMSRVRPALEYACKIWEGEQSQDWTRKLESIASAYSPGATRHES
jgi:hypothetical protein